MPGTKARAHIPHHAAFGGPAMYQRVKRSRFLSDDDLTQSTISHMLRYIVADTPSDQVQTAAEEVRAAAASQAPADLARATHAYMRGRVRYVEDADLVEGLTDHPDETEVLIRPADLFHMAHPVGDCDDFAMSTAALLSALGIQSSLKTAKCNPFDKKQWSHVYNEAELAGGPLVLDTSHGPTPDWEVSPIFDSRLWPVPPMQLSIIPKPSGLRSAGDWGGEAGPAQDPYASSAELPIPYAITYGATPYGGGGPYTAPSTSGFNWGGAVAQAETSAAAILGARYGVAQLNPGQYMRNADGSVYFQGAPGQNIPGLTSSATGGSSFMLLGLAAVAAVVVVVSMNKGK